jgi:hypothetical protein
MDSEERDDLRRTLRWIGWLLLDYRAPGSRSPLNAATHPPTTAPDVTIRQWIASAGGLGALHTYPHGLLLGVLLIVLLDLGAYGRDDMSWAVMVVAALTYCALPGFLASRRLRSFWYGGCAGALIGPIGVVVAMTIHGLVSEDSKVLLLWWVPLPAAAVGFMLGTVGAAVAQPSLALNAIRDQLRQP